MIHLLFRTGWRCLRCGFFPAPFGQFSVARIRFEAPVNANILNLIRLVLDPKKTWTCSFQVLRDPSIPSQQVIHRYVGLEGPSTFLRRYLDP